MSEPLGAANPALLAQVPELPRPANADSLSIAITEWGDVGPMVLMVHGGVQGGIGGGPTNFHAQRPLADRGWRLRLMDRPGFGDSPSRGPDDMEADAVIIADHLGEGGHLIGHSFGGAGALLAAARRPEAVRSLTLIEPALQPLIFTDPQVAESEQGKKVGAVVAHFLMEAKTPAEFAMNFARSMSRPGTDANASLANITDSPEKAELLGHSLLRARGVSPVEMKAAADAVRQHGVPVLIISSGYNEGQEITAAVVARATGGKHVVVPGDSHFIQRDTPDQFNAVVDAFMRESESRTR